MTDLDPRIADAMHRPRAARTAWVVREGVLTVGAVLGALCLLAGLATLALGVRPMVFRSGSMAPAIDTGALAFTHETAADELAVGDIVSVITSTGSRVTHRITRVTIDEQGVGTLELKGDANETADQEIHRADRVDRVFFSVPWLGYVVGALSGPAGLFLLGLYAAFLFSVLVKGSADSTSGPRTGPPTVRRPGRRPVTGRTTRRRRRLAAFVAAVTALVGGSFLSAPAWAMWSDPAPVLGTTLAAVVPTAPVVVCGPLQLGSVTVTWTPVPAATGYRLSYGPGGGTSEDVGPGVTSKVFTGTTGTFSVRALYGGASWISTGSNAKVYSSLVGVLGTCT